MRQIMRSSLDYAGFAQLCGRLPIMREIMRAHNRIIPRSLTKSNKNNVNKTLGYKSEFSVNVWRQPEIMDGLRRIASGRLFQARGAATAKARSPIVDGGSVGRPACPFWFSDRQRSLWGHWASSDDPADRTAQWSCRRRPSANPDDRSAARCTTSCRTSRERRRARMNASGYRCWWRSAVRLETRQSLRRRGLWTKSTTHWLTWDGRVQALAGLPRASYADRVFVVPRLTETQHVDRLVTFYGDDVIDFPGHSWHSNIKNFAITNS